MGAELPPRARRIHNNPITIGKLSGTTSACAENTSTPHRRVCPCRNYLRVRGEYSRGQSESGLIRELPPRARRILVIFDQAVVGVGTTSACAENTLSVTPSCWNSWNYLRVRGEYHFVFHLAWCYWELPPRARRIRFCCPGGGHCPGTTSACAENTITANTIRPTQRNYLRVRGEYQPPPPPPKFGLELPPRARRIHQRNANCPNPGGTTSACAENTAPSSALTDPNWNYLRVRGEYSRVRRSAALTRELPPRARRIRYVKLSPSPTQGTTSACAENTLILGLGLLATRNYLRVRGEYGTEHDIQILGNYLRVRGEYVPPQYGT